MEMQGRRAEGIAWLEALEPHWEGGNNLMHHLWWHRAMYHLEHRDFDTVFTRDKPVIFAYHGYPWLIHRLTYRRTNHGNLHVRGYKEEGTTTTPFDMAVLNDIDRFHLAKDVVDRVPSLGPRAAYLTQIIRDKLIDHRRYIRQHGEDMPEIRDWTWAGEPVTAGK